LVSACRPGGGVDALDHHELQEADTVVGVAVAERVLAVGVGRWVRGAVERREREGLEPGGAGLGQAGEEDVRWVWLEARASAAAMPLSKNSAFQKPPYWRCGTGNRVSRGSESMISAAGRLPYRLRFFLLDW
jgi:hypothetical protein